MIKTYKISAHNIDSESGIAKNNLVITEAIFVKKTAGVVDKANATGEISGVSFTNGVFASDNESKAKKTVNFAPKNLDISYEVDIKGGSVSKADEGKKFNLTDEKTVNGTTGSSGTQVILVEFISAKRGIFKIV